MKLPEPPIETELEVLHRNVNVLVTKGHTDANMRAHGIACAKAALEAAALACKRWSDTEGHYTANVDSAHMMRNIRALEIEP